MSYIPNDPVMLLSFLNTKLRDEYPSLEELCVSLDIDITQIKEKLKKINYTYIEEQNQSVWFILTKADKTNVRGKKQF